MSLIRYFKHRLDAQCVTDTLQLVNGLVLALFCQSKVK